MVGSLGEKRGSQGESSDASGVGDGIWRLVQHAAAMFPAKIAVQDMSEHPSCPTPHAFTWSQVWSRCRSAAAVLADAGVARGDRVAVLAYNSHVYFEVYFAIPLAGGVLVPLNFRLADEELRACIDEAEPVVVLADEAHLQRAESLASNASSVRAVMRFDCSSWEESLRKASREAPRSAIVGENDPAAVFYTGGAEGGPKGVVLSHRNLTEAALRVAVAMDYGIGDVYLHCGPMFHLADGAGSFACTLEGSQHVFIPSFEPGSAMLAIERFGVTTMTLVPTMYKLLLDHPDFDPSLVACVKKPYFSAAPMPETLLGQLLDVFPEGIGQGYGMTETSSRISVMPPVVYKEIASGSDPRKCLLASAGRPIPGLDLRIVDEEGRAVGNGEVGEIAVRGPTVMLGYWRRPELTSRALRDGWMYTGDLGCLDADGFLYVLGRKKDMIVTGGENVYALEVENWLLRHPCVEEAAVVGLPDDLWGERVHAVLVPAPGKLIDRQEVVGFLRKHLAGYKVPKSFEVRSELPRTGAGKIDKESLRRGAQGIDA